MIQASNLLILFQMPFLALEGPLAFLGSRVFEKNIQTQIPNQRSN